MILPKSFDWFELNPEIEHILSLITSTRKNLNILGPGGTGKTTLLKLIQDKSILPGNTITLSSTGIASALASSEDIKATTVHNFFGLKPFEYFAPSQLKILEKNISVINSIDTIIIDEISMVNCNLFDFIIELLLQYRAMGHLDLPRMILFGDIFQLPPVINKQSKSYQYFKEVYGDNIFYYNSRAFVDYGFETVFLKKIYRQKETSFQNILNRIRLGSYTKEDLKIINERCIPEETFFDETEGEYAYVALTNATVDFINRTALYANPNPEYLYKAVITGDFDLSSKKYLHEEVVLKKGCKCMILKNNISPGNTYQNGMLGEVVSLSEGAVKVHTRFGDKLITEATWQQYEYQRGADNTITPIEVGSFKQIPLSGAFAFSVHKAQGQQFTAFCDFESRVFGEALVYVALTRAPSLRELALKRRVYPQDISINRESLAFLGSV